MSRVAVAAMIVLALLVRTRELNEGIVRFHPTRHYRSAVLARACYYDHAGNVPQWAKRVGDANRQMQQAGEPPIMEWLACGAYLAIGDENVTIARAFGVIIWVLGAIPLWLLTRRLASESGALVAVALYLFLPYGIVASRNFQPDQLMTVASLIAILTLVRLYDHPTRSRLFAAAVAIAAAGLIKPMSVFLTVPVALALTMRRNTDRVRMSAALVAGMTPPIMYYGYSAIAGSLVQDQMRMRFEPHLIPTPFFYEGLWRMISRVETVPLFLLALSAAFLAPDRLTRTILAALFAGYAMFAVGFTYHMPTHDYYHLPYIAVTALGVGALVAKAENARRAPSLVIAGVLCAIIAAAGSIIAWPRLHTADAAMFERMYQEIGELVEHDTKALFLDTEYGFALMYHGEISGDSWPNVDDLAAEAIDRRARIDADARYVRDYKAWGPSYFIVTDLRSFAAETDLQQMLDRRSTPVRITDTYRVYRFNESLGR